MLILAKLLDLIPSWLWAAVTGALVVMLVLQGANVTSAQSQVTTLTAQVKTLELAIAQANAKAETLSATFATQQLKAQNEASIRESTLRGLAVAARSESAGLLDDLATLRKNLANATRDAAVERATALSTVLGQCDERYTTLAGTCDRHVSDIKTLMDAWPVTTGAP